MGSGLRGLGSDSGVQALANILACLGFRVWGIRVWGLGFRGYSRAAPSIPGRACHIEFDVGPAADANGVGRRGS